MKYKQKDPNDLRIISLITARTRARPITAFDCVHSSKLSSSMQSTKLTWWKIWKHQVTCPYWLERAAIRLVVSVRAKCRRDCPDKSDEQLVTLHYNSDDRTIMLNHASARGQIFVWLQVTTEWAVSRICFPLDCSCTNPIWISVHLTRNQHLGPGSSLWANRLYTLHKTKICCHPKLVNRRRWSARIFSRAVN